MSGNSQKAKVGSNPKTVNRQRKRRVRREIIKDVVKEEKKFSRPVPHNRVPTQLQLNEMVRNQFRGRNQHTALIAEGITNPGRTKPTRFRSVYSSRATAVAKPFSKLNAEWHTSASPATNQLPETAMFAALFRDIFRAQVVYKANPTQKEAAYKAVFTNGKEASADMSWTTVDSSRDIDVSILYWNVDSSSTWSPHGDRQYVGLIKGDQKTYTWLDHRTGATSTMSIAFNAAITNANDVVIVLYKWDNGVVTEFAQHGNSAGSSQIVFSITESGYYGFKVIGPGRAAGASNLHPTAMAWATDSDIFAHLPAATLTQNLAAINDNRVLAASIMYTNTASPLNKQGKIAMLQFGSGFSWHTLATAGFDQIADSNGAIAIPINEGMYGYLKPTGPDDFDLQKGAVAINSEVVECGFILDGPHEYIVCIADVTTEGGRDGYFTFNHHVEYETTDVWRDQEYPGANPKEYEDALLLISKLTQFSTNDNHLTKFIGQVRNLLSKGVNAAEIAIPKAMSFLEKVGPIVGTIASIL